ncbi:MAG: hypothetical protein K6E50_13540 [Lachnospiraceae bacterium]|nr:hypothetical protein [Lachnospiraceae bacterium]
MEAEEVLKGLAGTWYEDSPRGAELCFEDKTVTLREDGKCVSMSFSVEGDPKGGNEWKIRTVKELFPVHVLIFHPGADADFDILEVRFATVVYDAVMTPRCFKREPYAAPKYGEVHFNTDEKAIKWFQDYRVRKLLLKVAEPHRESGMMAPIPPTQGFYVYEVERTEDNGGILRAVLNKGASGKAAMNFEGMAAFEEGRGKGFRCPDVEVSPEEMNELALCIANGKLDQLNGLDVWQDDVPSTAESFDLSIEFYKESYHARANHVFVPEEWKQDGRKLHLFLFRLLVRAGLDYYRNEFHSTKAMQRFTSNDGGKSTYNISLSKMGKDEETVEMQGEAYPYTVDYPVGRWVFEGEVSEALRDGLDQMLAQVNKEEKARGLWLYGAMAAFPEEERQKKNPPYYASRLIDVFRTCCEERFFSFWMLRSEQHSLPIEGGLQNKDPLGDHLTYCFDAKDGHLMCAAEFYTDTEKLLDMLIKKAEKNNSSGPQHDRLVSPAYREILRTRLNTPNSEGGMGFQPTDEGMLFRFISDLDADRAPWISEYTIAYDESRDIINTAYSSLRSLKRDTSPFGYIC